MVDPQPSQAGQIEMPREEVYRDWLGLKTPNPSYYGLLGLPELETDQTVILHAGRRVKRKLRAYQIGPYRKQALEMLGEVGQCISVLTNAERKRDYDLELLNRWRGVIDELYQAHCAGLIHDVGVLETWLKACVGRGMPVARLLPWIVRRLGRRLKDWPPHGAHKVGLPINMWIYRDAVVLGQCLSVGTLGRRVEAVKNVQKALGISEGLARLVAEEVTGSVHLFAHGRFVSQAKRDPELFLVRLGRRVRRYGGHLGRHGRALTAMAMILGMPGHDIRGAFDRLAEREGDLTPRERAVLKAKKGWRRARQVTRLVLLSPQVVVISLAVLVGVTALVLAALVVGGVWQPWKGSLAPAAPAVAPATEVASPPSPEPLPPDTDVQGLEEFIKKYPAGKEPWSGRKPGMGESAPAPEPPVKPRPPRKPKSPTKFFNVPAEGREPGDPVERGPSAPPKPAPIPPAPPSPPPPAIEPPPSEPAPPQEPVGARTPVPQAGPA